MIEDDTFAITVFDPFKFHGQSFGEAITFNNAKQHVRFSSKFHEPDYLSYSQIAQVDVLRDRKNWMLWVGILTLVIIVGLILLLARIYLPPWKITIHLKKDPPLVIRARLTEDQLKNLLTYPEVQVTLLQKKKKGQ